MIRLPKKMHVLGTPRKGVVLPLAAALMVVLIGMLAFAVDLGYISLVRGQMQAAADSAALAGTSQLFDRTLLAGGTTQDTSKCFAAAQKFATANKGGGVALTLG